MAHYSNLPDLMDLCENGELLDQVEQCLDSLSMAVTAAVVSALELDDLDFDIDPDAFGDGLDYSAFCVVLPDQVRGSEVDPVSLLVDIHYTAFGDLDAMEQLTGLANAMIAEVAEQYGAVPGEFNFMGLDVGGYLGTLSMEPGQTMPEALAALDPHSSEAQAA